MVTQSKMPNAEKSNRLAFAALIITIVCSGWYIVTRPDNTLSLADDFWTVYHDDATPQVRTAALLRLLAAGNEQWEGANLSGIDLSNLRLVDVNIQNAQMNQVKLGGAVLTALDASDLADVDLSHAKLDEASFLRSTLDGANFTSAGLRKSALEQVFATEAIFQGADLSESYCLMADFTGSNFQDANFTYSHLEATIFINCELSGARFDGAILLDADFTDSNWWRATGVNIDLIEDFKFRYSPKTPALQEDYLQWLKESESPCDF
jgi:uncharacterized protein YjbI with pentapeptide repeats